MKLYTSLWCQQKLIAILSFNKGCSILINLKLVKQKQFRNIEI